MIVTAAPRPPELDRKIAVLTGLRSEARLLERHTDKNSLIVQCAASVPERARHLVDAMVAAGATHCLSFGIAGGLAPDLPSGAIVIAESIAADHKVWPCDPAWVRRLSAALPAAHVGGIWGSDRILAGSGTKARLYHASHALTCDMESHILAAAAAAARLPFTAIRAVCDPAAFALPPAALLPLRPNGKPDLAAILRALIRQPRQLPALLRLASHNGRAHHALAQTVTAITA